MEYSPSDLSTEFYDENKQILSIKRGAGLWLWKPYLILKTLNTLKDNDYLFYCDSGSYFVKSINHLVDCLDKNNMDIMAFDCPMVNHQFTKSSFNNILGINNNDWILGNQTIATFLLLKKTENSVKFVKEYLELCKRRELLLDPDLNESQHDLFVGHRHDQSILSYLVWKHKIKTFRDPSQYGVLPLEYAKYSISKIGETIARHKKHKESAYPIIVLQYRNRPVSKLHQRLIFEISVLFKKIISKKLLN